MKKSCAALLTACIIAVVLILGTPLVLAQDSPPPPGGAPADPESEPGIETPEGEDTPEPEEAEEPEDEEEPVEEKKPEPKTKIPCPPGEYLCGKGFAWQTEDGEYSMRIGGRFQFHWILDNYDIHRLPRLDNNAEFGIPRAYVFVTGHAFKEINYALSYRIDNGVFDDWTIAWAPKEADKKLCITTGHFKPRFSREFLTSSGGLSLVNRNMADAEFRLNRDYGLNLTGMLLEKKLRADLGFFNGFADSNVGNTGFRIAARIQLDINAPPSTQGDQAGLVKPAFSVGAAYSMENDAYDFDGNSVYDDNETRSTFDCTFYWHGLNVVAAYFARTEQNRKTVGPGDPNEKNRNSLGYSLQGSCFVVPGKLELVAMMSYVELDVKDPRARRGNASGWKHENRFGVSYYLREHSLKIQADCGTLRERQTHGSLDDKQARVQLTLNF